MATERAYVTAVLPASVDAIREAWLDPARHAAMTGGSARVRDDGVFEAWGGYIEARTLEHGGGRIVQNWRTRDFPADAPDSRLELELESDPDGTRVTITHLDIPAGQAARYAQGWYEHYLTPMELYFGGFGELPAKPATKAKPAKKATKATPAKATKAKPAKKATKTTPAKTAAKAKPAKPAKKAAKAKPAKPAKKAAKAKPAKKAAARTSAARSRPR